MDPCGETTWDFPVMREQSANKRIKRITDVARFTSADVIG
jgi:hypothetical protein